MRSPIPAGGSATPRRCWSYRWAKAGDRALVQFTGKELRLDEAGARALADEFAGLGPAEVWLDFRQLEYVGSSTLATLVQLRKGLLAAGRWLCFCPLPERLAEAFAALGLGGAFDACPEEPGGRGGLPGAATAGPAPPARSAGPGFR